MWPFTLTSSSFLVMPLGESASALIIGFAAFLVIVVVSRIWDLKVQTNKASLEAIIANRTAELRNNQSKLEEAIALAISANQAKDTFLAHMSHELRTPLNAILGFAQLMLKERDLDPQQRSRAQVISRSGEHLLTLINQILDLTKIENGRYYRDIEVIDIEAFFTEVANLFQEPAANKSIEFRVGQRLGLTRTCKTDPVKLRQILFNLLSNAIKFTPENGKVELRIGTGAESDSIRFEVEDNGPGISASDQPNLFQPFYQTASVDRTGVGLGLCISKKMAGLLGGTLSFESHPGRGSRFWVDLPAVYEKHSGPEPVGVHLLPRSKVINYRGERKRILVVDDDVNNRSVLHGLLVSVGFEVAESVSGFEALQSLRDSGQNGRSFAAVLLDIHMPQIGGIETLVRLTSAVAEGAIPCLPVCIAVSASVFDTDQKAAVAAGFDAFLPKPIREDELYAILGRALNISWIHEAKINEVAEPNTHRDNYPVTLPKLNQLIGFARTGDVVQLSTQIQELAESSVDYASLRGELNGALQTYQMSKIRTTLELWRSRLPQQ
jgi:signal transduction histidine kinase/FixJ family two-component response regulator